MAIASGEWSRWVGAAAVQTTNNATIRADLTTLSARVTGTILDVPALDFARVEAGDLIVAIDPADYEIAVAAAEAGVAGAEASLANLANEIALQTAAIGEAEAGRAAAEARRVEAEKEQARQAKLLASTFGTPQKVEQADADLASAVAAADAAAAAVEAAKSRLAVLKGTRPTLDAALRTQRASLAAARLRLSYTTIRAPFDGVVGARRVQPGDFVAIGSALIDVVPLPDVYVIANYKETQLTHVAPGQSVEITVDSFPGTVLTGTVERISPASGAEFALLPPDNATGNFTKVVQRIPVRIALDGGQPLADRLRPGMSVVTRINTEAEVGA
nr:HlyD family secretion protein [Acuticoccus sediminis]